MPPPDPVPIVQPKLHEVVGAIATQMHPDRIGTGPLAVLRRLDPRSGLTEPAMQRLLWGHVPDAWLTGDGMGRWALLVHALALGAPHLHRGSGEADRFGQALFAADYSEGRLTRLLHAGAEDLPVAVPRAVRFLVAKGRRFDPVALARFVHGVAAGGQRAEEQREALARDYFRAERDAGRAA